MFTHKSLIVSLALILALAFTGIVAASAHTAQPTHLQRGVQPFAHGIPAIPALSRNQNLLSFLDIRRYIQSKGFVGGSTLNGLAPTIQTLQLTRIIRLGNLFQTEPRQLTGNEEVYYAHLNGPFLVLPNLPLPILSTLLPSLSNLPAFLPHLANLSSTGLVNILPYPANMPDLSHWQSSKPLFNAEHEQSHAQAKVDKDATVLAEAYEIFDAHDGNLLAWG